MEQCASTSALNKHLEQQEKDEWEYEELLEMLRDSEPEEYKEIINSFGYDEDITQILEDL